MPLYLYQARDAKGELQKGRFEGGTSAEVADHLLAAGLIPIDIRALPEQVEFSLGDVLGRTRAQPIGLVELQLFSRQLHTMLRAGVPILRALASLRESSVNTGFARVLADINDGLGQGRELSVCLARHPKVFDSFYLAMIRVGEMTGRLDEVLDRLAVHLDFERRAREMVKGAIRYPLFVIIALVVAMGVINLFVIPAFAKVYSGMNAELPLMTQILIATSNFTRDNIHFLIGGAGVALLAFRAWINSENGRYAWDRFKLRLPVVGKILRKSALARFARSFALASRSGVPILQVLTVVSAVADNRYYADKITRMREGVERGESLLRTATLAGVFTPVVLQMLAVGEETGEIDNLLQEIAVMYEQEVEYEISTLSQQIEPILITALGAMVLVLALGVFLPIWDMGSKTFGH
ncbi:MAG: type II secretion system F family protein [Thiobacillus sp.]|nr:type II secretion system F family protein [Thiobacillus sp.]